MRTIVLGRPASLFFHFAKRTNQAEGCYQNFRLRDKLNYDGNSGIGGHTAENCDGEKKLRDRKVKNGPCCKSVAATRKSVIARKEKRARLGGVHYTRIFPRSHSMGTKRQLLRRIFIDGRCHRRVVVVFVFVAVVSGGRDSSSRRRRHRRGSYCRLRARWRCLSESIWIYDVFLLRRLGRTFLKRHLAWKHYAIIYYPSSGARAFRRGPRQR